MVFRDMMRDKVTLVKANGTVARQDVQARVPRPDRHVRRRPATRARRPLSAVATVGAG